MDFQGGALLLQRVLTVLSAGFNALYFFRYLRRMPARNRGAGSSLALRRFQRRKVAVAVLACTNLALLVGGLVPLMVARFNLGSGRHGLELIAALLSLAAASSTHGYGLFPPYTAEELGKMIFRTLCLRALSRTFNVPRVLPSKHT